MTYKEFGRMDAFQRETSALGPTCPICGGSKMHGTEMCYACEQAAPLSVWVEKYPNDDGRLFQYER